MKNDYKNSISNFPCNLKQLRLAENLTQKQVAEYLGITIQSYYAYEAGIALPTFVNFISLCEFFDITPNELLDIS